MTNSKSQINTNIQFSKFQTPAATHLPTVAVIVNLEFVMYLLPGPDSYRG